MSLLAALHCMGLLMAIAMRNILHQLVALAEATVEAVVPMTSVSGSLGEAQSVA